MKHRIYFSEVVSVAKTEGEGYQTLINDALRQYLSTTRKPVDPRTLRRILREEPDKKQGG